MKFARLLGKRSAPERLVIACLRGDLPSGPLLGLAGANEIFARLAGIARQRNVEIYASPSPFISEGEISLLTCLATAQRSDVRFVAEIDATEIEALLNCALLLRECGIWLPLSRPTNSGRCAGHNEQSAERPAESPELGMVRARALSLARARHVASTREFAAAGVSRQYVSRLCKDGFLQRVRYGWYRAAPPDERSRLDRRHHR